MNGPDWPAVGLTVVLPLPLIDPAGVVVSEPAETRSRLVGTRPAAPPDGVVTEPDGLPTPAVLVGVPDPEGGFFPQPLTRICRFSASLRENDLSQWPHGNGLTSRWIRL